MTRAVGLFGYGHMGSEFARRLVVAGFDLVAFDVSAAARDAARAAGIEVPPTPQALIARSEVILLSLPRPKIVLEVVEQIAAAEHLTGLTVIDTSTSGVDASRTAAATAAVGGVAFLDAPVSGGVHGARDGTLSIMAAGDRALFDQHQDVLMTLGSNLFHVGDEPGQGQVIKVVNNILSLGAFAAAAEATTVAMKAGIALDVAIEIINASTGASVATRDKFPRAIISGTFALGGTVSTVAKDCRLFEDTARALGVPTTIAPAVVAMWQAMEQAGLAGADASRIAPFYQEKAGIDDE